MYIYHCFRSYDWEETLVFTVIGLYRPIYGNCIHQCIFFACTFVNLPESVKIFTGNSLVFIYTILMVHLLSKADFFLIAESQVCHSCHERIIVRGKLYSI